MANLISYATKNWTDADGWKAAEAGSGAAQATISGSTNTTGSYVASSAFTCTNTDVLEGVLMHCCRLNTTGTVTIGLSADGGTSYTREVTVNASDLPEYPSWRFFEFTSTLTADGGADYKVAVKASSAANATFYRDGTAGNWAHLIRTSTTAGPNAADVTYIVNTITMNETASTDYGAINIGSGGTLSWGTSASTAYYHKVSGNITVYSGGAFNMGTTGTPVPSTSTAELLMDSASATQYGLILKAGSSCQLQGSSMTYTWALLAADAAANATSLTTSVSTGWADNDVIWLASTTRLHTQCEGGALNGAASGTTLTVDGFAGTGGGVKAAHSGTSPTQAEVINLSRNVKIYGASTTNTTYIILEAGASIDADWAEFYNLGANTATKYGITITGAPTGFNFYGCSVRNAHHAWRIEAALPASSRIENCVSANAGSRFILFGTATTDYSNLAVKDFVGVYAGDSGIYLVAESKISTLDTVRIAGTNAPCLYIAECGGQPYSLELHDCVFHSSNTGGVDIDGFHWLTFTNCKFWRCNTYGCGINNCRRAVFTSCDGRGNGQANGIATQCGDYWFSDCAFSQESSYTSSSSHISLQSSAYSTGGTVHCYNCTFGALSARDYSIGQLPALDYTFGSWHVFLNHCRSYDTAYHESLSGQSPLAAFHHTNYNQTSVDHRSYYMNCTVQTDTAIYKTASPSERITPSTTAIKSESGLKLVAVDSSATVTVSAWVRKSEVGDIDGADYNGAEPRLILRRNDALGITSDTVLDTMTAAVGTWEQLSGTTAAASQNGVFEFFVDLDGTAGWINVDDWSAS